MDEAGHLIDAVAARLTRAGCVAADEESVELVEASSSVTELDAWVYRREQGEPLAWITGSLRFCGHDIRVEPGVYVPRVQSEALAERAADRLAAAAGAAVDSTDAARARSVGASDARRAPNGPRALDVCTGAGAIAVHLKVACPGATVVGVDVDRRAVGCARRNGVRTVLADLAAHDPPFRLGAFDVVTAVAPYVPTDELLTLPADVLRWEPRRSLDGGPDGLRLVRRIIDMAARLLPTGGWLFLEVGGEQDRASAAALADAGFDSLEPWADEDGDLRGIGARRVAAEEGPRRA